jgi:DNA-binding transcriptional ArsR family regulator
VLKEPNVSIDLRKCQVAIVYTYVYVQAAIDAIAEPRRREILQLVRDRELAAGRIAAHFDVTRQAVSQHLRVLHEAGLVSERRDGTRRIYRARPEGLAELRAFLDEFWSERLEALRREVETEHRRRIDDGDRKH